MAVSGLGHLGEQCTVALCGRGSFCDQPGGDEARTLKLSIGARRAGQEPL